MSEMNKFSPLRLIPRKKRASAFVAVCLLFGLGSSWGQDATVAITGGTTVRVGEDLSYEVTVSTIGADYGSGELVTVQTEVLAPNGQAIVAFGQVESITSGLSQAAPQAFNYSFTMPITFKQSFIE